MGQRIMFFSDLSGIEMADKAARITVEFSDKRRGTFTLDVTDDEAQTFADKGTKLVRAETTEAPKTRKSRKAAEAVAA